MTVACDAGEAAACDVAAQRAPLADRILLYRRGCELSAADACRWIANQDWSAEARAAGLRGHALQREGCARGVARDCDVIALVMSAMLGQGADVAAVGPAVLGEPISHAAQQRYAHRAIELWEAACARGYPRACLDAAAVLTSSPLKRPDMADPVRGRRLLASACALGSDDSCAQR